MIEWNAPYTSEDEATGKLMCTILDHSNGDDTRKTQFILSFTRKQPGIRFQEVLGGSDKAIPIPFSSNQNNWEIEKFCIFPYFEDEPLNIKNCSLEIEFLKIEGKILSACRCRF